MKVAEFCPAGMKGIALPDVKLPGFLQSLLRDQWKLAACLTDETGKCRGCIGFEHNPLNVDPVSK